MPAAASRNRARNDRRAYRKRILSALTEAGFVLAGEPTRADENQFFSADLFYLSLFDTGPGLRPHIRVEMSLKRKRKPIPTCRGFGVVGDIACADDAAGRLENGRGLIRGA